MQIVGIGLSTLDVLIRLGDMPSWEQGGRMREIRLDGGGEVGTAIVTAARLGARVGFVGTAGNDEVADLKMRFLTKENVDVSRVVIRPIPENQIILCFVHKETGERVFCDTGCMFEQQLAVNELDRDYVTSAEFLLIEGFHHEAALQAALWMHEAGKKVMLDAGRADGVVYDSVKDLVRQTDILICSSGFSSALTGIHDIWEAGRAILQMGPTIIVETEGAKGCYTVTSTDRFFTPSYRVAVVDTTGAGDVFHGAYLVGLLHAWDLRTVASFACAVSAIKCTRLGGRFGIPNFEEVLDFLNIQGISARLEFEKEGGLTCP